MPQFLTVKEAADKMAVTPAAVYTAVKDGRLPAEKIYGRTVLSAEAVEAYARTVGTRNGYIKRGPTDYDPNLSAAERATLLQAWADSHERSEQPLLDDEAITREAMYAGAGGER